MGAQIQTAREYINKAVTSETANTEMLILHGEQLREFIDLTVDTSVMLKDATHLTLEAPSLDLANLDIPAGRMAMGLGYTEEVSDDDQVTPVFGGRTLNPKTADVLYEFENTHLPRYNIARGQLADDIDAAVRKTLANEIENNAINSEIGGTTPDGYATGSLTTIDGWATLASSGHVVDHAGGYVNPKIFKDMWKALPAKWRADPARKSDFRFYVSDLVAIEYRDYLSRRTTSLGDLSMTQEGDLSFAGVPITPVPAIPIDKPGVLSQSDSAEEFTFILLVERGNMVVGYGPEMRFHLGLRQTDGKVQYYSWWGEFDVNYRRIDAVVVGRNIRPEVDPSLMAAY